MRINDMLLSVFIILVLLLAFLENSCSKMDDDSSMKTKRSEVVNEAAVPQKLTEVDVPQPFLDRLGISKYIFKKANYLEHHDDKKLVEKIDTYKNYKDNSIHALRELYPNIEKSYPVGQTTSYSFSLLRFWRKALSREGNILLIEVAGRRDDNNVIVDGFIDKEIRCILIGQRDRKERTNLSYRIVKFKRQRSALNRISSMDERRKAEVDLLGLLLQDLGIRPDLEFKIVRTDTNDNQGHIEYWTSIIGYSPRDYIPSVMKVIVATEGIYSNIMVRLDNAVRDRYLSKVRSNVLLEKEYVFKKGKYNPK